ncbi:MAG: isoprenylcysteine carboxylmethyltransferase family protein [Proteobacteria bacterium]|nr:isoprenylcysteine carboxylmethyltransferase family protein [Pseudomonadota bacterium]
MRFFLAIFLLVAFLVVFVLRSLLVWRRTGVNPIVFQKDNRVDHYIGRIFVMVQIFVVLSVVAYAASVEELLFPLQPLQGMELQLVGAFLLLASTAWCVVAQAQMGQSWRIGIDRDHSTSLVTTGLFRISRNPIFLAMGITLVGLFLVLPTAVTLAVMAVGHVLINIQVRLEENHLESMHQDAYRSYCRRVRRWV